MSGAAEWKRWAWTQLALASTLLAASPALVSARPDAAVVGAGDTSPGKGRDLGASRLAGGAAGGAPAAGGGATADAATAKRLGALRKKTLKDDDFVENDETNRDPFHSYLRLFVDRGTAKTRRIPAVFDHVGLEELTLIAIVSGDDTPRAMFRDASGFGQSVKTGDFLSRVAARVTKILSDRVIVEVTETRESGEPRLVEKAILVNPGEAP